MMHIMLSLEAPEQPCMCAYKRRWPGQMRCSNMAADSKTEKKLGHNLTITRTVLLPKTYFTDNYRVLYCKVHSCSLHVSRVSRSIERGA